MTEPDAFAATHVRLLGVLFVVWGGVGLLVGAALLLLATGAAAIAQAPAGAGAALATRVTAATLSLFGVVLVLGGAAHAWVGTILRRRHGAARLAALVLALPNLFLIPFGTVFGAYGLWVLLDERVRRQFDVAT